MALLQVTHVFKKEKDVLTVNDISFTQEPLQKIAVAGETGSGKTTLLKIIAGLLQADSGELRFEGKKLMGPNDQLIPGHAGIAYLSQHFELRNNYWVHEILSYANTLTEQEAINLYKVCRIDHLLQRRTDQLSGGEKQRIALARLIIGKPRLLLLDEPFSNLDETHKQIIKSVADDLNAQLGISTIMVSHHAPDILPWANQILVMKEGKLVQAGNAEQVYRQPVNSYCAGLFGDYNLLDAETAGRLHMVVLPQHADKKLLVRPEAFTIVPLEEGLPATIQQILFMGSCYLVLASIGKQQIKISTTYNQMLPGDTISIAITPGAGWWL